MLSHPTNSLKIKRNTVQYRCFSFFLQHTHVMMYSFGYSCDCLSSPQLSSPLKNWLGMDKRATRTCLPVKTNSCNIGTDTKPLNFIFRHVATVIETLGQNRVKMKRSNILILMSKKNFSGCDFIWATLLGINPLCVNIAAFQTQCLRGKFCSDDDSFANLFYLTGICTSIVSEII